MKTIIACIALILASLTALAAQCGPDNDYSKCRMVYSEQWGCIIADEKACLNNPIRIDDIPGIDTADKLQLALQEAGISIAINKDELSPEQGTVKP